MESPFREFVDPKEEQLPKHDVVEDSTGAFNALLSSTA